MRLSILKTAAAAALALVGTFGLAWAEVPVPLNPDQLGALVLKHTAQRLAGTAPATQVGRSGVQAQTNGTANATANLPSGWNSLQCTTAYWYFDGTYTYLFGFNVGGSYLYAGSTSVNLTTLQATLLNACGSGTIFHANLDASGNLVALENR